DRFPLRSVALRGLLPEEAVDVRVASVRVGAARDGEGLQAARGVPEVAAEDVDDVLRERLEEGCPLERTESEPDSYRLEIGDDGLGPRRDLEVAEVVACVEAARVPGLGEELPGPGGVVRIDGWPPVEIVARQDDATGDTRWYE